MRAVSVSKAAYLDGYKLEVEFNDNKKQLLISAIF